LRPHDVKVTTTPRPSTDTCLLRFLYCTVVGRALLGLLIRPAVSKFAGFLMDSSASRLLIPGFVKRNAIDLGDYRSTHYRSFNEFFVRRIRSELRPVPANALALGAPCDGQLSVYPVTPEGSFVIKGSAYTLRELLGDDSLAREFDDGVCLVFRLAPSDYHRYIYFNYVTSLCHRRIPGVFHTVRPISHQRYKAFAHNTREYEVLETAHFGTVVHMEVGALLVGRIVNQAHQGKVCRGEEKGRFEFGGSTVVVLFKQDQVAIDEDFIATTQKGHETVVKMGQPIGLATRTQVG